MIILQTIYRIYSIKRPYHFLWEKGCQITHKTAITHWKFDIFDHIFSHDLQRPQAVY